MTNPKIKDLSLEVLSDNWYTLRKATYQYQRPDGSWQTQYREAYDRGNGAGILLYDKERRVVLLTRQFRLPTYINGNENGMMVEVCAGLLDEENPDVAIIREVLEETGYEITEVEKVMEAYMSPGSVTEILYLYIAPYDLSMKVNQGGGVEEEQEDIETFEVTMEQAISMIQKGEIKDAKTIMLLQYMDRVGWDELG